MKILNNAAKRGVEFRRSTRNALRIRRKVENGSVLMGIECFNNYFAGSLGLPCYVRDTM